MEIKEDKMGFFLDNESAGYYEGTLWNALNIKEDKMLSLCCQTSCKMLPALKSFQLSFFYPKILLHYNVSHALNMLKRFLDKPFITKSLQFNIL